MKKRFSVLLTLLLIMSLTFTSYAGQLYLVSGSSMSPTLHEGDVVSVNSSSYENGDMVVADTGNKKVIKRVEGSQLIGDNRQNTAVYDVNKVQVLGKAEKSNQAVNKSTLEKVYASGQVWNYGYTGGVQSVTLPAGKYKFEVWGAQGGTGTVTPGLGGNGGYSYGEINLAGGQTLYVYVGGQANQYVGGFNGGGNGGLCINNQHESGYALWRWWWRLNRYKNFVIESLY